MLKTTRILEATRAHPGKMPRLKEKRAKDGIFRHIRTEESRPEK